MKYLMNLFIRVMKQNNFNQYNIVEKIGKIFQRKIISYKELENNNFFNKLTMILRTKFECNNRA